MNPQDRLSLCLAKAGVSLPLQATRLWQDMLHQSLESLSHLSRAGRDEADEHLMRLCETDNWSGLVSVPMHATRQATQQHAATLGVACQALALAQAAAARAWLTPPSSSSGCCDGAHAPAGVLPFDCLAQAWQGLWQAPPEQT